jgi:hypothetical protein
MMEDFFDGFLKHQQAINGVNGVPVANRGYYAFLE